MSFGQLKVFLSIFEVFSDSDNRFDSGFAGALQNLVPVLIKAGVTHMCMYVNQFGF